MPDHHITLTVKSTSGTWSNAEFNTSNKVEKILEDAIKHFPLNKTPQGPYTVVRESTGQPLGLNDKISDTGLQSGEVVVIQAGQPVDG
jgi:hypothetical protein